MENICEKNYGIGLILMNQSINIFVLNWNGMGVLNECLSSLNKISYQNSKIIVIDNGSKDDSVDFISKTLAKKQHTEILSIFLAIFKDFFSKLSERITI